MNRELLEKPFEPGQIKQRVGTLGNTLDYIEGQPVIKRLNEAFDGKWSFEILRHEILEEKDEVVVLGKLTAEAVVKAQFGCSQITRAKETGEIVSIADDLKAAETRFEGEVFMDKVYNPYMKGKKRAPFVPHNDKREKDSAPNSLLSLQK